MIADVFQARVERIEISNSAALGAAMRAAHACSEISWEELNKYFTAAKSSLEANSENAQIYEEKLKKYQKLIS